MFTKTDCKYLLGLVVITGSIGYLFAAYGDAKQQEGAVMLMNEIKKALSIKDETQEDAE